MDFAAPPWSLLLFQSLAFWVALLGYRGRFRTRFLFGLGFGALLGRLGWILLFLPGEGAWFSAWPAGANSLGALAAGLLQPGSGISLLFVPLGPIALAPAGRGRAARLFWASSARALAPAIAIARFGCIVAGCCSGRPLPLGSGAPDAGVWVYPTAAGEFLAWLFVSAWIFRLPQRRAPALFLLAFGGVRLVVQPLRADLPLGDPWLDPSWIALAWLCLGLFLVRGQFARSGAPRRPPRRPRFQGSAASPGLEASRARWFGVLSFLTSERGGGVRHIRKRP